MSAFATMRDALDWSPQFPLGNAASYDPMRYGPVWADLYKAEVARHPWMTIWKFASLNDVKPRQSGIRVRVTVDGEYYGGSALWIPRDETLEKVAAKFFGSAGIKYEIKRNKDGTFAIDTTSTFVALPARHRTANATPYPESVGAPSCYDSRDGSSRAKNAVAKKATPTTGTIDAVIGTAKNGILMPDMRQIGVAFAVGECADIGSPGYPGTLDCRTDKAPTGSKLCDAVRIGDVMVVAEDDDCCCSSSLDDSVGSKKKKKKTKPKKTKASSPSDRGKDVDKKTNDRIAKPLERESTSAAVAPPELVPVSEQMHSDARCVATIPQLVSIGTRAEAIGCRRACDCDSNADVTVGADGVVSIYNSPQKPLPPMPKLEPISGFASTRRPTTMPPLEPITPELAPAESVGCEVARRRCCDATILSPMLNASDDYTFVLSMIEKANCSAWMSNGPMFILAPPNRSYDAVVIDQRTARRSTIKDIVAGLSISELRGYLMNHMGPLPRIDYLNTKTFVARVRVETTMHLETMRRCPERAPPMFNVCCGATQGELIIGNAGNSTSTENRIFVVRQYPRLLIIGLTSGLNAGSS